MSSLTNQKPNKPEPQRTTRMVALIIAGGMGFGGLWMMSRAECGAKLDVNLFPLPHIRIEKLACPPQ